MIKITKVLGGSIIGIALLFSSCSDMLKTDSDMLLFSDDHRIDSANDSLYSVIGILSQLKTLGDRYVLLGELRGDLMDITERASIDLQEINKFSVTAGNVYNSTREYYAVINNCNYFLHYADSTMLVDGKKVFYPEIAAVKAIRAWTYMQLVLNYEKAYYIEEPILTVEDSNKEYPQLEMAAIAEKLIEDLTPFVGIDLPKYGEIGGRNASYLFIPVEMILGDLCLWTNRYHEAANHYYNLMFRNSYTVRTTYASRWQNPSFYGSPYRAWGELFSTFTNEVISVITSTSEYGKLSPLYFMTVYSALASEENDYYSLLPSETAVDMWNNEVYTYYDSNAASATYQLILTKNGDLRGYMGSYRKTPSYSSGSFSTDSVPVISKYLYGRETTTTKAVDVFLLRSSSLYLRYAEAINQTGRPTLAMAVLKNGLNEENFKTTGPIDQGEINPLLPYCNFGISRFSANTGIRLRGLGDTDKDTVYCVIPKLATKEDSIAYVDDLICKEYALETAFEGNRFHDLMRFALRRNDPAYLARKVAAKHNEDTAIYEKLLNQKNWYLPLN